MRAMGRNGDGPGLPSIRRGRSDDSSAHAPGESTEASSIAAAGKATVRRLSLLFVLAALLVAGLAAYSLVTFSALRATAHDLAVGGIPRSTLIEEVTSHVQEHRALLVAHVVTTELSVMDEIEADLAALEADVDAELAEYDQVARPGDFQERARIGSLWSEYVDLAADVVAASRRGDADRTTLVAMVDPALSRLVDALEGLAAANRAIVDRTVADVEERLLAGILSVAGLLGVILAGFAFAARAAARAVRRSALLSGQLLDAAVALNNYTEMSSLVDTDEDMARLALHTAAAIAGAEEGAVHLASHSGDRATVATATANALAGVVSLGDLGRCPGARRGGIHVTPDLGSAVSIRCPAYPAAEGALVCIPMTAHGELIGTVHLHWPSPTAPGTTTIASISRTAEHAALTIANRRLVSALRGIAATDPRTQLANTRAFDQAVDLALRSWQAGDQVAVLMIDIDHFKAFNDRHGHPAGDEALRAVAGIIKSCLRDGDLAARYGGEEFAVLLPRTDEESARQVAERIRERTASTFITVGPGVTDRLTLSAGVAAAPHSGLDRMVLMRAADSALYTAKQEGRNRVVVADGLARPDDTDAGPDLRLASAD